MEDLRTVRKWFQYGTMCVGLDLKGAFLHVPMDARIKKFLWFKWKGKLYEWQVLPFGLECSPQILTFMVVPIVKFFRGRGISSMAFMDDFTNQAKCRFKGIFQISVIVFFKVFQRKPKWRGIPVGSKMVFTQLLDQPQHMNTRAITWIWKITLHLHFTWFVKSSIKAVKLMPLPQRNLTIGATM